MSSTDIALSVSTRIAQRVKRLPKGKPFCISRFAELGARGAISKAVVRLVSQGELERVHRGIYMRPKSSRYVARVRPNVWEVVSLIARQHRHVLQIHGAHAVRLFGLSTQMPLIPIYYTSGPSRSFFMGKAEVRLVHAEPMVMQRAGTEVGTAISALFYLGKDGSTPECIAAIKKVLRPEDLTTLMACKMPKWMRMALELSARIHTVNTTSQRAEQIVQELGLQSEAFEWYQVSKAVGNVKNTGAALIGPLDSKEPPDRL